MPTDKNHQAERWAKLLEVTGMTNAELAKLLGIHRGNITNYIKGKYSAKQDVLYELKDKLGINPQWMMGIDDNMYITEGEKPKLSIDSILKMLKETTPTQEGERIIETIEIIRDLSASEYLQLCAFAQGLKANRK